MTIDRSEAWRGVARPDGARLPADEEYWDGLKARVVGAAVGDELDLRTRGDVGSRRTQRWLAIGLAASAVLAVLGTWLGTSRLSSDAAAVRFVELERALGPADPLAQALLSDPSGPAITELIRASNVRAVALDPNGD